jgi:hypothetical protein
MLPDAFVKPLIRENLKVASQEREEDLENTILATAKGFSRNKAKMEIVKKLANQRHSG